MTNQPDTARLNDIAQQAESDLNSYESKTGNKRDKKTGLENAGVCDVVTNKFPDSTLRYGDDLVTNAGLNRRIPPDEGGDIDDHGRFIRGNAYLGTGGPEDKIAEAYQSQPGAIDESVLKRWGKDPRTVEGPNVPRFGEALEEQRYPREADPPKKNEVIEQGRRAAQANLGRDENDRREPETQGKSSKGTAYQGAKYELPESVPDQSADMGCVAPASVVHTSRRVQEENV